MELPLNLLECDVKNLIEKLLKKIDKYERLEQSKSQVELLHKIRVNSRKLVALSPPESYSAQVLKRLIQSSNALRDLDVLQNETLKDLPEKWQKELRPIYQYLAERRHEMDAQFKLLLQMELRDEIQGLVDDFDQLQKKSSRSAERHKLSLSEIERRLKLQLKILRAVDIEDKQVHKVRLKIKRLRYQLEHFYVNQEQALELTTYLQDELGKFQDLCQGMKWLKKYLDSDKTRLKSIQELLQSRKDSILQSVRKTLHKDYRRVSLR